MEADYRPLQSEPVGGVLQVSYGDTPIGSQVYQTRGLGHFHRPEGCLPAGSSTSGIEEVPQVCGNGSGSPISGFTFRPHYVPSSLYEGDGSHFGHYAQSRISYYPLPRRLVSLGFLAGRNCEGEGVSSQSVSFSGNTPEHTEIPLGTDSVPDLSGDSDLLFDFEGFSDAGKDFETSLSTGGIHVLTSSASQSVEKPVGSDVIVVPSGSELKTPHEVHPASSQAVMGLSGRLAPNSLGGFLPGGSSVVVRRLQSDPRGTTGVPHAGSASLFRRVGPGVGRNVRVSSSFGPVVSRSGRPLHQSSGASGYSSSSPSLSRQSPGSLCRSVLRQHDFDKLPQEARRYPLSLPQQHGSVDPQVLRGSSDHSPSPICSGIPQRDSGCSQPFPASSGCGVVPVSIGIPRASTPVACKYRSVCDQAQPPASSVLLAGPRPFINRDRRYAPQLGPSGTLCISSVRPSTSGSPQVSSGQVFVDDVNSSFLAPESLVPGYSGHAGGGSGAASSETRSTQTASFPSSSPEPPRASPHSMETFKRAAQYHGFSSAVAEQLTLCRRRSTRVNYQAKWAVYRTWCRAQGHSVSRPSIPKIAEFLLFLRKKKALSYSAIAGYRSMLSAIFKFHLPEISSSSILKDLLRSFMLERPRVPNHAPPWDLSLVLSFLRSDSFEPLSQVSLRQLTKKVLFLLSLATARRVGELQAVHRVVSFSGEDAHLSYVPEFRAKTESEANPLPRSFVVKSLKDFVGNLEEELLLCPVRALRIYLNRTKDLKPHPRTLFVSPKRTFRSLSKNAISFFLREVISQAYDSGSIPGPSSRPRAHSIRGMATSVSFLRNFPVKKVLEAACWSSSSVFTSFYLKDIQFSFEGGFGLGPFVAASCVNH